MHTIVTTNKNGRENITFLKHVWNLDHWTYDIEKGLHKCERFIVILRFRIWFKHKKALKRFTESSKRKNQKQTNERKNETIWSGIFEFSWSLFIQIGNSTYQNYAKSSLAHLIFDSTQSSNPMGLNFYHFQRTFNWII